mgnify:CR=1 FL=1
MYRRMLLAAYCFTTFFLYYLFSYDMDELKTNDYLKGIVLNLPESPGIYQYLNAEGTIIYVGKSKKPEAPGLFLLQQRT